MAITTSVSFWLRPTSLSSCCMGGPREVDPPVHSAGAARPRRRGARSYGMSLPGTLRRPPDVRSNGQLSWVTPTSASDRRHLCDPHGCGLMRVASASCDRVHYEPDRSG